MKHLDGELEKIKNGRSSCEYAHSTVRFSHCRDLLHRLLILNRLPPLFRKGNDFFIILKTF